LIRAHLLAKGWIAGPSPAVISIQHDREPQIDLVTTLAGRAVISGKRYRDCIRLGELPPVG
jgi:hypothetical protein